MRLALWVEPLGNADATIAAAAQPVDEQPIEEAGEKTEQANTDDDAQRLLPRHSKLQFSEIEKRHLNPHAC